MGVKDNSNFSDTNSTLYKTGRITVATTDTEAKVGVSRETERQFVRIYNDSNDIVYFGEAGTSTTDKEPLQKKQSVTIPITDIAVMLQVSSGTADVIVTEIG